MKRGVLLVFVLLFSILVFALPPCADTSKGGIGAGDVCYNCGDSDGVCPEDFEGVICRVEDPDCEGYTPPPAECADCGDFEQSVCDSSECKGVKCFWDTKLKDECLECNYYSDMECEYYTIKDTCETDNCGLGNCEWDGSDCVEEVVTAECGNDVWEEGEECDGDKGIQEFLTCDMLGLGATGDLDCFPKTSVFACRLDITDCSDVVVGDGVCGDEDINVHEISGTYEECDCGTSPCITDLDCDDFNFGTGDVECEDCELDFEGSCDDYTGLSCVGVEECEDYDDISCEEDPCSEKLGTLGKVDDLSTLDEGDVVCALDPDDLCATCYICEVGNELGCAASYTQCEELKGYYSDDCYCGSPTLDQCDPALQEFCDWEGEFPDIGEDVEDYEEREEEPWPWYDNWELMLTFLMLISYYSILHKRLNK